MTKVVGRTSAHQQTKKEVTCTIALNFHWLLSGHRWHPCKRPKKKKHSMQNEGGEERVPQFTFLNTGSVIGRADM